MLKKEEEKKTTPKKDMVLKTDFFTDRIKEKENNEFSKGKRITFFIAILVGLVLVIGAYFISDVSNIYRITVSNNHYLSEEEILTLSGLSTDDKFYLFSTSNVEKKISGSDFVKSCSVSRSDGNLVSIVVNEKKIVGYTFEDDKNVFVLEDDSKIEITKENLYMIDKVPLISGFSDEEIVLIEKNLENCDYQIINEISDIINYPDLKYQNVELIMRDGNYVFTSVYGLDVLNKYFSMENSYKNSEPICYYFEDISGNAYTSACPWNRPVEEETTETDTAATTQG